MTTAEINAVTEYALNVSDTFDKDKTYTGAEGVPKSILAYYSQTLDSVGSLKISGYSIHCKRDFENTCRNGKSDFCICKLSNWCACLYMLCIGV